MQRRAADSVPVSMTSLGALIALVPVSASFRGRKKREKRNGGPPLAQFGHHKAEGQLSDGSATPVATVSPISCDWDLNSISSSQFSKPWTTSRRPISSTAHLCGRHQLVPVEHAGRQLQQLAVGPVVVHQLHNARLVRILPLCGVRIRPIGRGISVECIYMRRAPLFGEQAFENVEVGRGFGRGLGTLRGFRRG